MLALTLPSFLNKVGKEDGPLGRPFSPKALLEGANSQALSLRKSFLEGFLEGAL